MLGSATSGGACEVMEMVVGSVSDSDVVVVGCLVSSAEQ